MKTAVEISLYPLQDDYLNIIKWFIERLRHYPEFERQTNGMSTQLQGEHAELMAMLSTEMEAAYAQWGRSIFVCKFIPGGVNLEHSE